jgi:two-component system, OmpR family, response regulator
LDLVVAAHGRNGSDGLHLMRRLRSIRPDTCVILTGEPDPVRAASAMRAQAYCYFHKPLPSAPLADIALQALEAAGWRDDIRMLSTVPAWISFEVRCKLNAAERATQFVRELEADLPHHTAEDVTTAFREMLLNSMEHGGRSDPRKKVRVSVVRAGSALTVHFHDPGKGFAVQSLPHAAICNPEDSPLRHAEVRLKQGQRPGGYGIMITRKLVDELIYNERGNEALFTKYLR